MDAGVWCALGSCYTPHPVSLRGEDGLAVFDDSVVFDRVTIQQYMEQNADTTAGGIQILDKWVQGRITLIDRPDNVRRALQALSRSPPQMPTGPPPQTPAGGGAQAPWQQPHMSPWSTPLTGRALKR